MGDHLHADFNLGFDDIVEVTCNKKANVLLMTDSDYSNYKARRSYRYIGGCFTKFPAYLAPPHSGHWHVVLNLGGATGTIKHSIRIIKQGAGDN